MGQYFILVNKTKREYVRPDAKFQVGAKFWEWCASWHGAALAWLMRKSNCITDGADIPDFHTYRTVGRWAGDECYVVGDYDSSGLYQEAMKSYRDITVQVLGELREFIEKS